MSKLWQHPYVNIFKHFNISEWKKCAKEGEVTPVMDKTLKCTVYRITGSIPAGNYIQFPRTSTQSLGLTGRYLYVLFKPMSGKYFVAHFDIATEDGLAVRVSFSNLFKEFKSTSTWLQFPFVPRPPPGSIDEATDTGSVSPGDMGRVAVSTRFTFLMLDLQYIASIYLNQRYAYVKNIRLCANMLVKGLFTSDTEYEPGMTASEARKLGLMSTGHVPVPREMAFHVPKGTAWHDLYDVIKFPAKSTHVKTGVIHGEGVIFSEQKETEPTSQSSRISRDHGKKHKSTKAVAARVALVDKLSPKNSSGKRKHVVAKHVPSVGLERPVGVDADDHLDTQVYAYTTAASASRKKPQSPRKDRAEKTHNKENKPLGKNSKTNEVAEEIPVSKTRRGFKSLKPDPILKLKRLVGFGGATFKEVLWSRNGASVIYPCHAVIVSMDVATGHQRFFMGHTDKVSALTFNGNTSILASAQIGQSTVIRIWRYHSGECIAIFNSQVRSLHCLSFSKSGGVLCGCGKDNHGKQMVVVWDTSRCGKGGDVSVLGKAHTDVDIARLKIAPFDDTRIVSCGEDNIRFWRIRRGSLRSCPVDLGAQHSVHFTDVCFGLETINHENKKQRSVYACTRLGTVFEVNYELMVIHKIRRLLPTGARQDLIGEDSEANGQFGIGINCVSVNEAFCMTGSDDGYLRLWPLDFSGVVLEAEHDGPVTSLDISSDGLSILAGTSTGNVGLLDIATRTYKTLMRSHTDQIVSCTFDPSHRMHLITVSKDETIRVWDMETLCQLYDFRAPNESPCAVVYHPHQHAFACGFRNGAVRVFNIGTASMLVEHKEHRGIVSGLAFSPNGEHMFSAGSLGTLVLYEGSGEELGVVRILVNSVSRGEHLAPGVLSVSEDSQRVAVIGPSQYVVTVMEARTLHEVLRVDITTMSPDRPHVDTAIRLCYAPSSLRQLLVVTSNCRLLKLDSYSGQLLSEVTNIHRSDCSSLHSCNSGKFLVTAGDRVVKIWDYHMRLDLNFQVFIGHSETITKVGFSPDLQNVVTIGECIFIWDFLADGRVPTEPGGRTSPPKYLSNEPDTSVHVSGNVTKVPEVNGQAEQRPRSPVTAVEIPARPHPSPSPTRLRRTDISPQQSHVHKEDQLNPLMTSGLPVPKNTPETQAKITKSTPVKKSSVPEPTEQGTSSHLCPTVTKHYKREQCSAALPARRYTAPPSQAGLNLRAVLDYNGAGRSNMIWNPETGLFAYTSGCIIIIEDLHDGKQRHFLGHVEEISTLALQHDVQYIASASGSSDMVASQICIWQVETGVCKKVLTYHAHEVVCLAYSRDDRFLISVGDYRECSVVIWDTKDYRVLTSSFTTDPIHDLCWDPFTMNEFVSVGENGNVLFWLLDETRGTYNLNVYEAKVPDDLLYLDKETDAMVHFTSAQYAGDSILYVGNNQGMLSAWDIRQNKCFMHWDADDSEIDVIVCHRGQLITGGCSGHLRLWSVVGVSEMRLPGENNVLIQDGLVIEDEMSLDAGIISAKFDASMEMGIVGTVGGTLWYINWTERTSIRLVSSHTQKINSLIVSGPDDKYFATCSNDGSLRVWTSDDLEQTLQFQVIDQRCTCVSFCPTPAPQPTKNLTTDGQILATVHPHEKPLETPVRPSHCVAGYNDGTVRLFDLGRVEMIMKIHPHGTAVTAVTFSADGRVFITGSSDGVVAISSPATGLTVRLIQDHKGAPITTMDIAPIKEHHPSFTSPRMWLVASGDRRVSVWSTDWSKDYCELIDWLTFPAPSIAPDGTSLKKGDMSSYTHLPPSLARFSPTEPDVIVYTGYGLKKQIQFYSLAQRKVVRSISITQWASSMEISPKGHLIAIGTHERLVKVLDYQEGSFQDFVGHCGEVSRVCFSPTGSKLYSVGTCDVILWDVVI